MIRQVRASTFALLAPAIALVGSALASAEPPLESLLPSVVRVVNYTQRPDWSAPWKSQRVVEEQGSGFVVAGGLVLTNAHVVSDSRHLLLSTPIDSEPFEGEVVHVAHDCDLALVRAVEPGRTDPALALRFGGLPALGSTVDTLGFPAGGRRVASGRGVVSRIEEQLYSHTAADIHVAVQTDAAINPGMSGGPVIQDGAVVGVAFQYREDLQNVGHFVPVEVIERFLRDVEDGRYDGYPELGTEEEDLRNPAARAYAGLGPDETGVRVFHIVRGSSADGHLEIGDVIVSVNDRLVGNDGSVEDGDRRLPFGLLIDRMFVGEIARVRVLRGGQRLDVDVPLKTAAAFDLYRHRYDETPRFFVYGGLIFVPLTRDVLATYGNDWPRDAPQEFLDAFLYRPVVDASLTGREQVVLLRRLDHPVNAEMAWFRGQVVERVNGRDVTSLEALIEAFERHDGEFHLIEFVHSQRFGVLDRGHAETSHGEILERYGVPKDRQL